MSVDPELSAITAILKVLTKLDGPLPRARVLDYVISRAESLGLVGAAQIDGGGYVTHNGAHENHQTAQHSA